MFCYKSLLKLLKMVAVSKTFKGWDYKIFNITSSVKQTNIKRQGQKSKIVLS